MLDPDRLTDLPEVPSVIELTAPGLHYHPDGSLVENPQFAKLIARMAHEAGFKKAAVRVDLCSTRWQSHRLSDGRTINQNHNPCRDGSLCQNCHHLDYMREFDRYKKLAKIAPNKFVTVVTQQETGKRVRAVLEQLGVPVLSRVAWSDRKGRFELRIMVFSPASAMSGEMQEMLRGLDVTISVNEHQWNNFDQALHTILKHPLPPDNAKRIELKKMHRKLSLTGVSQADREKLFRLEPKEYRDNSGKTPWCNIHNCCAHSETYWIGTPKEQILWMDRPSPPGETVN